MGNREAHTEQQTALGWGKSVVETLSNDIQKEFPGIKGFGMSNMWDMARFYTEYHSNEFLQPLVGEISWSKHIIILTKCKDTQQRQFYILATKKFGWTKDVLINKIELKTYEKYMLGQHNFENTLPENIKKQAVLAIKDEYSLNFVELDEGHSEYELEQSIVKNIRAFLMEFGMDFSFIGNQYRIEIEDKEYFIDLLLYSRRLQAMIAIDLLCCAQHKSSNTTYQYIAETVTKHTLQTTAMYGTGPDCPYIFLFRQLPYFR